MSMVQLAVKEFYARIWFRSPIIETPNIIKGSTFSVNSLRKMFQMIWIKLTLVYVLQKSFKMTIYYIKNLIEDHR